MRKKLKFVVILFSLFIISGLKILAQSPEHFMQIANRYYQEKNYQEAINTYQKILSQGYESSALYYNLGNSYFRLGKLGYAILNYERALKLSPGDDDILYNLRIANARTVDRIIELPKLFIVKWWEILLTSLTLNNWSLLTILFYMLLLISISIYLYTKNITLQRYAFNSGIISLIIFVILIIILISRFNYEKSTNYGILLESVYSAKVAPDENSNDVFIIHEGVKFIIEDKVNDWSKIRLADGKIGWIQNKVFEKI